ncbi:hypothetical protein N783_07195 [Pontibacillus marinus BH030004 = DSM 16465]|uniref:Uncharacterized protein n=1 Tax=Pontibacillus marinus BH030004 = DSM 16465 TaxID=1385511 RepID=A0A0A5GDI7_9BACI|nr:hypothetical protein N783_07195 [Pontibacillus marinus BH030004 = DSM 16465]
MLLKQRPETNELRVGRILLMRMDLTNKERYYYLIRTAAL